MHRDLETEFKLRATQPIEVAAIDAAVREADLVCASSDSRRHVDTYFDDDQGSLSAAGVGLRLRADRSGQRVTCKRRGQRGGGLFVREEHEAGWTSETPPQQARDLPSALRDLVEPLVFDRPLLPQLRLETLRDTRLLQSDANNLCELAVDRVEASALQRTVVFQEVEVEVLDDLPTNERLAAFLLERLPLHLADDDKPSHAMARLGLQRARPPALPVRGEVPIGQFVAALAARHLAVAHDAEVDVRRDLDPDFLHTMRVAVRRLRALVRAFRDLWPEPHALFLQDRLSEMGRQLGAVRDLDVMLANLPEAAAALPEPLRGDGDRLLSWVREQREVAQRTLHEWLGSPQRLTDSAEMQRLLATASEATPLAAMPLAQTVPPRLHRAAQTVRKLIAAMPPELPIGPLHELRIASKRLRYLAEEFADLPPHDYAKSLAAVARLQQSLGTVCDHELAARRLLDWIPAVTLGSDRAPWVAATLGGLAANHSSAAQRGRKPALRSLERVDRRKVWRRFPELPETDATLAP